MEGEFLDYWVNESRWNEVQNQSFKSLHSSFRHECLVSIQALVRLLFPRVFRIPALKFSSNVIPESSSPSLFSYAFVIFWALKGVGQIIVSTSSSSGKESHCTQKPKITQLTTIYRRYTKCTLNTRTYFLNEIFRIIPLKDIFRLRTMPTAAGGVMSCKIWCSVRY